MAILKVARMGHPVLREIARDLTEKEIRSSEIKRLVQDMIETMEEYGGIGLAAPQVHQPVQLALIGFDDENERYPDQEGTPLKVLFNPKITVLDKTEQGFWEGSSRCPIFVDLFIAHEKSRSTISIRTPNHKRSSPRIF